MGGLARRVSYEKALLSQAEDSIAVLQVDAGNFLSDDLTLPVMAAEARIKNEWVLKSFDQFKFGAANVSHRDLPYLAELMKKSAHADSLKRFPFLNRVISANVVPATPDVVAFKPYVIEELRSRRLGTKPLKVAVIGVNELQGAPGSVVSGYKILDPIETLKSLLPDLRKKVDLIVVLAYATREDAKKIGAQTTGIDIVMAAHQLPLFNAVDEAGDAVVGYVANQTKWLGEFRLYRAADAKDAAITSYIHRDVPLDNALPDDPVAAKVVTDARAAFTKQPPAAAAAPAHSH